MKKRIRNYASTIEATYKKDEVLFTSDMHFGSTKQANKRGFRTAKSMESALVKNWNRVVKPKQFVIIAGDFCMGESSEWTRILNRLNGRKILVKGNHDTLKKLKEVEGFEQICEEMNLNICNQKFNIRHEPSLKWKGETIQLFGHYHTHKYSIEALLSYADLSPLQYNIGVDNNDNTPLTYSQLLNKLESQKNAVPIEIVIYKEDYYTAYCPSLDLFANAASMEDIVVSMHETIDLYFRGLNKSQILKRLHDKAWSIKDKIVPPIIDYRNNEILSGLENNHTNRMIVSIPLSINLILNNHYANNNFQTKK